MSIPAAEPRLKTEIWVQAQVRLCDLNFISMVVARRGDPDAGAVVVRLLRDKNQNLLLRRRASFEGPSTWMAVGNGEPVDDAAATDYVAREIKRDPDLWVLEVDDPKARYWPDKGIQS